MELTRYVQDLQDQLAVAAEAAGGDAPAIAERLASTLDSIARLVLLEALSEAAGEITAELAPGSVDVRLRGRDPQFVVTAPAPAHLDAGPVAAAAPAVAAGEPPAEPDDADAAMARTTLRLPETTKVRVEAAAAHDGLSVNSWLVRVITTALGAPPAANPTSPSRTSGSRFTGWVR